MFGASGQAFRPFDEGLDFLRRLGRLVHAIVWHNAKCVGHHGLVTDDTTKESRHVSQWIDADPVAVYDFAVDPANLSRWAAGLANPALAAAEVSFAPNNELGVLDHVVVLPSGDRFYNPMRVIPAGAEGHGCEVVFTLRRAAGVTDEDFDADATAVAADLDSLRRLVERSG